HTLDKRAISNMGKITVLNLDQQTDLDTMHYVKGNVAFEDDQDDEAANRDISGFDLVGSCSKHKPDNQYDFNVSNQDSEHDGPGELSKKARLDY
ncbi:hypothetical protein BGZ74_006702, partial [Mortierella antarctica]